MSLAHYIPKTTPEYPNHATGKHTHYRMCTLCEAMCGIEVQVDDHQIVSIRGDQNDPFSQGYICPKATALQDLYQDPDRIRHPLKRTEHGWQKISWEEALSTTAKRLRDIGQQHGHDAVATYFGNPNAHNMGGLLYGSMFLKALRTKNKFSATSVDQLPHHIVSYQLFGHYLAIPVPDIDHTDFFLMIGANPLASNGSLMTAPNIKGRLKAIQARGGTIVVIDPRRSETAELADQHHFIRPNSDVLLLLALLHVIEQEQLGNPRHLAAYTQGLTQIGAFVAPYTPERVSHLVGISAEQIRQLARDFAQAKTAVCYGRMGASVQEFGTLSQYLIMLLNIVTGRLDARGGLMFPTPAVNIFAQTGRGHLGRYRSRVRKLPEFAGELPVSCLAEEMLTQGTGQIRAFVVAAGNPVLSTPNGQQLDQALSQLDFMVAIDFYINETNRHAHIILPPVSPLEREHYDLVFHGLAVRNTAKWSNALFEAQGDARQDWQIYLELTQRLTQPSTWQNRLQKLGIKTAQSLGPAPIIDGLLRTGAYGGKLKLHKGLSLGRLREHPHGIDLGALQPRLPNMLWHKDRQIHLAFDFFMADLSRVEQVFFKDPSLHADYPLLLIGRRHVRSNNSWLHNSHRLIKGKNRCTVLIHPQDAKTFGIQDNQSVMVRSRVGEVCLPAQISDEVMQGVVSIPHGFGHDRTGIIWQVAQAHAGVSVNDLTDDQRLDQLSGNAVLNGVPVMIKAVEHVAST